MSQINYKSKYLKYKAKYLFITNNQNGGAAAGSVPDSLPAAGSVPDSLPAAGSVPDSLPAASSIPNSNVKQIFTDENGNSIELSYNDMPLDGRIPPLETYNKDKK